MPRKQSHRVQRAGFTLIELLMVIAIIGLLVAIAIPQLASSKSRSIEASMRSDLRNLAAVQEAYYGTHQTYAAEGALSTVEFRPSANVTVEIDSATGTGWGAHADHPAITRTCYIAYGGSSNAVATCN